MMPFPWTLQRYILREMGKTFLLSAIALTTILGLGGGLLNMIQLGEVTPGQLVRLMGLVLPLAAALTLPVAALFAATSTYGRLSADNEFVACRASGINLHTLLLPTLALSLVAGGISFGFTNFVIPRMVRNLNQFIGADVGTMIRQRLNRPRGITLGERYRLYADETQVGTDDPDRLVLRGVAFVEVEGRDWVRYGTAREVDLSLTRNEGGIRIAGWMRGLSCYDRKMDSFYEEERQAIPPNDIEAPVPQKVKFLQLHELFHYWANPTEWEGVRKRMRRVRRAVGARMAYTDVYQRWQDAQAVTLSDENVTYVIRSVNCMLTPGDGGLELRGVSIQEDRRGRQRTITADRAMLELTRGTSLEESGFEIELYVAKLSDGVTTVERPKTVLPATAVDPRLVADVAAISDTELLAAPPAPPGDRLAEQKEEARRERAETVRRVVGAIHERLAFSVSMFVLVILGGVLGIVFRGSHVMTAFGISFVPAIVVIVAIVMGRQMSQNASTYGMGLVVMWTGIVGVAGLDFWTLTRVLRR